MLKYLVGRLFYSVSDMLTHWYINGLHFFARTTVSFLRTLDRSFAVRVSVENIFSPLYQDRSFLGYVLGFILRSLKIIIGGAIYVVVIVSAATLYLIWAFIPPYLLTKIIGINA